MSWTQQFEASLDAPVGSSGQQIQGRDRQLSMACVGLLSAHLRRRVRRLDKLALSISHRQDGAMRDMPMRVPWEVSRSALDQVCSGRQGDEPAQVEDGRAVLRTE